MSAISQKHIVVKEAHKLLSDQSLLENEYFEYDNNNIIEIEKFRLGIFWTKYRLTFFNQALMLVDGYFILVFHYVKR